jgi:hypothetical protein
MVVTKKWNSVPEFHWNNIFFSGIWNHLKSRHFSGISGKMPKKWNFLEKCLKRGISEFFFYSDFSISYPERKIPMLYHYDKKLKNINLSHINCTNNNNKFAMLRYKCTLLQFRIVKHVLIVRQFYSQWTKAWPLLCQDM